MEVKAELIDLSLNYRNGKVRAVVEYEGKPEQAETLIGKALTLILKPFRKKRSLNANAYCWELCTQIANVLTLQGAVETKEDIYFNMLKSYGQSEIAYIRSDVPPERFFKYYEARDTVYSDNIKFTEYIVYIGSSQYNSAEFSILLKGIVSEAEQLGISTLTPEETERLAQLWGKQNFA